MTFRPTRVLSDAREDLRDNAAESTLYARPPVGTATPLANMPMESAALVAAWGGSANRLYLKRFTGPRDSLSVLSVNALSGLITGSVGIGIYRLESKPGTGAYSGFVVPRLTRVWSKVSPQNGTIPYTSVLVAPTLATSPVTAAATDVDGRAEVRLSPAYDYVSAFITTAGPAAAMVGVKTVVSVYYVSIPAGWTDLPPSIDFDSMVQNSAAEVPFMTVTAKESTLHPIW